jgi:hypothetical protein
VFKDLLKQKSVVTKYPLVSMIITHDSTRTITISKQNDQITWINIYSLTNQECLFEEKIEGDYIKVKDIEQNSDGNLFTCAYFDDGKFRLRIFDSKAARSEKEIEDTEVKINEMFGIDDYSMPIDDFQDPFITCCFVSDNKVFVNFYHSHTSMHYHFIWHITKKKIVGNEKPVMMQMEPNKRNFPYKCFYCIKDKMIYSFYR